MGGSVDESKRSRDACNLINSSCRSKVVKIRTSATASIGVEFELGRLLVIVIAGLATGGVQNLALKRPSTFTTDFRLLLQTSQCPLLLLVEASAEEQKLSLRYSPC